MNHIKSFFKEKGLYLFCLALVFAATAAGILALRSVVNNMADLTQPHKDALQEDSTWDQPDVTVNNPASDVPEPTSTPSAPSSGQDASSGASSAPAAVSAAPSAAAAPSAPSAALPELWQAAPAVEFSGEELVYNETLGDWRTHNGADYAAAQGTAVTPVQPGKVTNVSEDALWGGVVEVTDDDGLVWRYCGLTDPQVETGDEVSTADTLGEVGAVPAEAHAEAHVHLECLQDGAYQDPESSKA